MDKPLYLWPFIFVYKMVYFITKTIVSIPRYAAIGFFFINITVITIVVNGLHKFASNFLNGFIFLSFLVYKTITAPFRLFKNKEKTIEKEAKKVLPEVIAEVVATEVIEAVTENPNIEEVLEIVTETAPALINEEMVVIKNEKEELRQLKEARKIEEQTKKEELRLEKQNKIAALKLEKQNKIESLKLEKQKKKEEQLAIKNANELKREELKAIAREEGAARRYKVLGSIASFFRHYYYGFMFINFVVYKLIKYVIFGLIFPFVFILNLIAQIFNNIGKSMQRNADKAANKKKLKERISREEIKNKAMIEKRHKAAEKMAAADKKREDAVRKREETIAKKKADQEKNTYINDKVKIEKKTFGDVLNSGLEKLIQLPKSIKAKLIKKYNSLAFVKNKLNQQDISREALLINFDGDDAVKSTVKILYEYVGKSPEGKVTKGYFEAFSKVEVHSFLLSEGYEVYSIKTNKWIKFLYGRASTNNTKFKNKDLIFFLTQLSTYIKAGIPLVEALKILSRQFRQKSYQRIFKTMIYDLTMGESFSTALEKQGVAFPRLLINMVKASEMTGELPEVLDNMADYFTATEKTRKQMITALIYPSIVFVMSMAVVTFIIMFVVPKFVDIYANMDSAQIPAFTVFIINLSGFLEKNIIWLFLGFAAILLTLSYLYKNVKVIRTMMQWLFMRTPVIGNIIIYNEVTIFTKTFSSLLSHNVFITDSMEVLSKITNNEIYKMIIIDTITNLAKGDKISKSFANHWAFPVPAYEMLVTGEKTGQLPEMMAKVSDYYQDLHQNSVTRLKSLIEPVLIVFLTFVVGGIILAIVIPMFSMFTMIK